MTTTRSNSNGKGFGENSKPKPEILRVQKACAARPDENSDSLFGRIRRSEPAPASKPVERLEDRKLTVQELARREQRLPLIEATLQEHGYTLEGFRSTASCVVAYENGPASAYDLLHKTEAELHACNQFLSYEMVQMRKAAELMNKSLDQAEDEELKRNLRRAIDDLYAKTRFYQIHYFLTKTLLSADKGTFKDYILVAKRQLETHSKLRQEVASLKDANKALRAQLSEFLNGEGMALPEPVINTTMPEELKEARPVKTLFSEIKQYGAEYCERHWAICDFNAFMEALQVDMEIAHEALYEKRLEEAMARQQCIESFYEKLADAAEAGIHFPA